jgi:hypothetical protein
MSAKCSNCIELRETFVEDGRMIRALKWSLRAASMWLMNAYFVFAAERRRAELAEEGETWAPGALERSIERLEEAKHARAMDNLSSALTMVGLKVRAARAQGDRDKYRRFIDQHVHVDDCDCGFCYDARALLSELEPA